MKNVLWAAVLFSSVLVMGSVRITFHDGSVFLCDRVVKQTATLMVVEQDGQRLSIKRSLVAAVEDVSDRKPAVTEGEKPATAAKAEPEPDNGKKLVLTDDNVERTVPKKRPGQEPKEEKPEAPPVTINVISQQVAREGERVTFTGTLRNDLTDTVNKLNMTVQALDVNGKVVAESTSMVAGSIQVGQTAPFSFQFSDPGNRITRFAFKFDGIIGGSSAQ